jgi:N-acetylmuramoyl-L-alanine amidase
LIRFVTFAPVFRFRSLVAIVLVAGAFPLLLAQEEDQSTPKPKLSPTAEKSPNPKASPKKKTSTPKPSETPKPKKKKTESDEEATPTPSKKKKAKASPSPHAKAEGGRRKAEGKSKKARKSPSKSPSPKKSPSPAKSRSPKKTPLPESSPSPNKSPSPAEESVSAASTPSVENPARAASAIPANVPQVNIEKSGFLGDQGYEPPPTPVPRRGWWFWSRPEVTYRYLSRSVRNEIDRAPVMRRRWQFIIVHNSGTRQGSARIFDYYHRHVRRMQNGLAYHFVIGNGTSTGDGEIEVGDRWRRQINGGHVHSDYLNNIALGICLVGDFNRDQPTRRQLEACEELINYLRKRCGKIDANYAVVRPHRDVNPPQWATDCPGDVFPYSWFRRFQE